MRLADFDRLCKQVDALCTQGAQLSNQVESCSTRTDAVEEKLLGARQVAQGFDVLRAVALQREYALGRALQRVLAMRLFERIKTCPTRPPAGDRMVAGRARQEQSAIVVEVPFLRSGVDELVSMLTLKYEHRTGRRTARPARLVRFSGAAGVLAALGVPVVQENMCRRFQRKDGSAPARPLIERLTDDDGSVFYVTGRDEGTGDVLVFVRESEAYHVRRRGYVHRLQEKRIARDSIPGLPEQSPAFISWRESTVSASIDEWEGAEACGTVTVSLPCCTMELLPSDVADVVNQLAS